MSGSRRQADIDRTIAKKRSMMDTNRSFVREPAAGSTLDVLGVTHIYKATAAETGGSFSLWEAVVPPGKGAPPHTHTREDETFYVLSGELIIEFEDAPHRVAPGGSFSVRVTDAMPSAMSVISRRVS
jgi:mannose-6-phosphate isomerase-like protein (cupin superfamily)